MATYAEELSPGVVIKCFECRGPVRNSVYHHQCDVQWAGGSCPGYCFSCMASRGVCKRCNDSYTRLFHPLSLRGSPEIRRAWFTPSRGTAAPAPPHRQPPHRQPPHRQPPVRYSGVEDKGAKGLILNFFV
jgi:hypothetical protein